MPRGDEDVAETGAPTCLWPFTRRMTAPAGARMTIEPVSSQFKGRPPSGNSGDWKSALRDWGQK